MLLVVDINKTMRDLIHHGQSALGSPVLLALPTKLIDHVGDCSWYIITVVAGDESSCSPLDPFQCCNLVVVVWVLNG